MSETTISEPNNSVDSQAPAEDDVIFPPLPDPRDVDFEDDINEEERNFYKTKFQDLNTISSYRLHCTSCDRHLGSAASNDGRMRTHPMLRTLVCNTCFKFYNSGEFEKGDDGSELYCRWCGQGGQVYCCSDCPHVFCAKCIKRNLGLSKIKEIENTDDWKCFKCNNKSLWDLRAVCWALMRYCDLKNRITMATQDHSLKETYQAMCARDYTECCKNKKRRDKIESKKKEDKKETDVSAKKATAAAISKIPPTIQVKKFACINVDELKPEKKAVKRSASPKNKAIFLKNPISIATTPKTYSPSNLTPMAKKIRMSSPMINPVRFMSDRKSIQSPIRIRPKAPQLPIPVISPFNGFNNTSPFNNFINDNINLSLESLTQGLDMSAVAAMANNSADDDVVCTPDFPMEPLCEVTEDNTDDDVQCITPAPRSNKLLNPPPLVPRSANTLPDLSADNIVQMTENDVTVNAQTGGLKFRVDPQTLSSNKMYRLPDGRIFAINANPNMPGGYSATIVAVAESNKVAPKGATYAAKLSAVTSRVPAPVPKLVRSSAPRTTNTNRSISKWQAGKVNRGTETTTRDCDLEVPVEWYRYNLIDAVDALEYSMSRLNKLKKDATTVHLRTRTVSEMRTLHKTLDRLLHTSTSRFNEIRDNLNKGMKQYLLKKSGGGNANISDDDDEDDDVEILPNPEENDDPIFIDENSVDSNANDTNSIDQQEVDLTGAMSSSELNDSGEKSIDMEFLKANEVLNEKSSDPDTTSKAHVDPLPETEPSKEPVAKQSTTDEISESNVATEEETQKEGRKKEGSTKNTKSDDEPSESDDVENKKGKYVQDDKITNGKVDTVDMKKCDAQNEEVLNSSSETTEKKNEEHAGSEKEKNCKDIQETNDSQDNDKKVQDAEMSEEMIETLLKGDDGVDDDDDSSQTNNMDIGDGDDDNTQEKRTLDVARSDNNETQALNESIGLAEGL